MGQVKLVIEASSLSGTAPLYVFFDATGSTGLEETMALVDTDFSWNFDTTHITEATEYTTTKGMVAGYVFETPGEYTVTCTATDANGNTDSNTITITVLPFTGTTYYISQTGADTNNGLSEATPWQTANHAFQQLQANSRILFKRGETFAGITQSLNNKVGGNMIIGAYGEGQTPVLQATNNRVVYINNSHGICVMDVHLVVTTTMATTCFAVENGSSNIVGLRLELEGATNRTIYQDESSLMGIFNSIIHHTGVLGVYSGDSNQFSFVNNTLDDVIGTQQPEHGIRIQGGEKQYIAYNTLSRLNDTKTAITIRGDGQRHVMIYRNKLDRILEVNPQNSATVAAISQVTIEGNYIGHSTNYTGQQYENAFSAINIEATEVAIRNNVIDGHTNAVRIHNDGNGVLSGNVSIYHNTFNWRPLPELATTSGNLALVQNSFNVTVKNNLVSVSNTNLGTILAQGSGNTNITEDHNLVTDTPNYTEELQEADSHINTISNYNITATSPGINLGENIVPVFFDANNTPRPKESQKDMGAFEYDADVLSDNEIFKDKIKVYPIPCANKLYISTTSGAQVKVTLVDVLGKKIIEKKNHSTYESIVTDKLKSGLYFLVVEQGNKKRTQKIIKQ
ncbi:T9SS type A sorting domain-containing protein [Tenacibaculum sp. TC6]|uniref:T9SS type A sorting domain-containing protein n=1 Tax=Tenacibaculum sp. TC6 TaxID=3423223 RepID=UPI003D36F1D1